MLAWIKIIAALGISVLLMGSKVIIHVPEGGSVVSSSGLVACSAGEVCTVDIDPRHFSETFIAVAEPGYTFAGWGKAPGAVCRASSNPHCEELDKSAFAAGFAPRPSSATRRMNPRFTSTSGSSRPGAPLFSIQSYHRTQYFEVKGKTQQEVWEQLSGPDNPLKTSLGEGKTALGHARFQYRYSYQPAFGSSSASCRVGSGELNFTFETALPALAEEEDVQQQLRNRWPVLQSVITEHEAGHHAIYHQLVSLIPQVLEDLGESPCGELDRKVQVAIAAVVDKVRQSSREYDSQHGSGDYLAQL